MSRRPHSRISAGGMLSGAIRFGYASGGGLLPETEALVAAMTPAPDEARIALIDATIGSVIAAGLWAKVDLLYLTAAHAQQAAPLNWINPATALTEGGAPTFTADQGFTGDASNNLLSGPNINALTHYTQNNASFGVWARTQGSGNSFEYCLGAGTNNGLNPLDGFGRVLARINSGSGYADTGGAGVGLHSMVRTASNAWQYYKNGAQVTTGTDASTVLQAAPFTLLGGLGNFSTIQVSAGWAGAALDATESAAMRAALLAYLQGVGAVA